MAVLPHFHDQHAGTAAFFFGESFHVRLNRRETVVTLISGAIDTGERHPAEALGGTLEAVAESEGSRKSCHPFTVGVTGHRYRI